MKESMVIKVAIAASVILILVLLLYRPAPTDEQVKDRIAESLVGKSITYSHLGGSTISFRISRDQIQSVEKTVADDGAVGWTAHWRSGPYRVEFYFDAEGRNEIGSKQLPLQ